MWNPLRKDGAECDRFRESLEEIATAEMCCRTTLRKHASECQDCEAAVDELLASRRLLSALPRRRGSRAVVRAAGDGSDCGA